MDNFGVVEVASQRRAVAPGWAYVPDNSSRNVPPGYAAAMAAAAAANSAAGAAAAAGGASGAGGAGGAASKNPRKRSTRNQGGAAAAGSSVALFSHLTSRQETKLRKELELLDRDGGAAANAGRDNQIPIPAKAIKAQNKYTPNVRKILASQKSFANHLDDFVALTALHEANPHLYHNHNHKDNFNNNDASSGKAAASTAATPSGKSNSRRPAPKKDAKKDSRRGGSSSRRSTSAVTPTPIDTPMTDAPGTPTDTAEDNDKAQDVKQESAPTSSILLPYNGPRPPPHPLDNDPLLISGMPPLPTDDELRGLVQGPPLTYPDARAGFDEDQRYPTRVFCDICGYWGRVKCTKCGTPVCALDCLELHREECVTRYGL